MPGKRGRCRCERYGSGTGTLTRRNQRTGWLSPACAFDRSARLLRVWHHQWPCIGIDGSSFRPGLQIGGTSHQPGYDGQAPVSRNGGSVQRVFWRSSARVHSMTHQDEIDTTGRYLASIIVLGDACLCEMVSSAQVQDLLFYRGRPSQGGIPGAGFAVDEPRLPLLRIGLFPFIKALSANAEVPAGL